MRDEIGDRAAIRLASRFYAALVRGASMETALTRARRELTARKLDLDVGLPVLFLRGANSRLRVTDTVKRPSTLSPASSAKNVGVALFRRGDTAAATAAYRLGAELGSATAANNLGNS